MKLFSLLLWLFPYSFYRDFGQEWLATHEEMWEGSHDRGILRRAILAGRITLDCLVRAPGAHAQAFWEGVVGPVPHMMSQGMGGAVMAKAWGRHFWESRDEAGRLFLSMIVGVVLMGLAHATAYLHGLSVEREAYFPLIWALFLVLVVPLVWMMISRAYNYVRRRKGPVLGSVLMIGVGAHICLIVGVLMSMPGMSKDLIHAIDRYTYTKDLLVDRPGSDVDKWTEEHLVWFDPSTHKIRDDKKDVWCATRMGWSAAQLQSLKSSRPVSMSVHGMLWSAEQAALVGDGCQSYEEYFDKRQHLAQWTYSSLSAGQIMWMALSRISPTHDIISSGHFNSWVSLNPQVKQECLGIHSLMGTAEAKNGQHVKHCELMEKKYGAMGSTPLGELAGEPKIGGLPPKWMWGPNLSASIDRAGNARVLGEKDIDVIIAEVRGIGGV